MPKVWWRAPREAYRIKFAMTDLKDKLGVKNMGNYSHLCFVTQSLYNQDYWRYAARV